MMYIALWAIMFLVVLGVIMSIINSGKGVAQETTCRTSVITSQKIQVDNIFVSFSAPRTCKPIPIGELEGTREEIKYQISELAAKCWWMWLEGSITDVFGANRGQTACSVCYYFTIPEPMDLGRQSTRQFFQEVIVNERNHSVIEIDEMYNYMIGTTYDRKILYGGGTKQYIGDVYNDFRGITLPNPQEIRLAHDLSSVPRTHIQDFTGKIKKETETEIEQLGQLLYEQDALLFVVVADKIQRNDRTDARRLIESLNMNSAPNKYDAALITIDATKGEIRMHLGGEHQQYIDELEIEPLLKLTFQQVRDEETLNTALLELIRLLREKYNVMDDTLIQELNIPRDSFYAYLTNNAQTMVYLNPIEINRQYAIAYTADSAVLDFVGGLMKASGSAAYALTIGISGIAGFFFPPAWYVTAATAATAYGTGLPIGDGLKALSGSLRSPGDHTKNSIVITRSIYLDEVCTIAS